MLGPCCKPNTPVDYAAVVVIVLLLHLGALAETPTTSTSRPDLETIVKRLTDAQVDNRTHSKAYSLTREYKVFGSDASRPRTQVLAVISFLPPNMKSYDIDKSTGGMGEKVVRHILDHEVDATRNPKDMMVDERNYDFEFVEETTLSGHSCYKLNITPKRERKDLLNATIWVDKDSYRILRMEGDPSKSPSFWVKDVHLTVEFGEVAGMWLQTGVQAMARLRFGGDYTLMSHDVNYDIAQRVATNTRPAPHRRHPSALVAAGMN